MGIIMSTLGHALSAVAAPSRNEIPKTSLISCGYRVAKWGSVYSNTSTAKQLVGLLVFNGLFLCFTRQVFLGDFNVHVPLSLIRANSLALLSCQWVNKSWGNYWVLTSRHQKHVQNVIPWALDNT
mmetsp:Transcript_23846/g.37991  ORF Transcript_23846/g.37991 Transcript_23846/m.37991 type:complete len:125 (+) Transcript_23846:232-606(+)